MKQKQTNNNAISAKDLYPSKFHLAFWTLVAAVRVSVLAAASTIFIHPFVVQFSDYFELTTKATFMILSLSLHSAMIYGGAFAFTLAKKYHFLDNYLVREFMDNETSNNKKENNNNNKKEKKKEPQQTNDTMYKGMITVGIYHFVLRIVLVFALWKLREYPNIHEHPLPSFLELCQHYFVTYFTAEIFNYWIHRLWHEGGSFFSQAHSPHHEHILPEAMSSEVSGYSELLLYTLVSYLGSSHHQMSVHLVQIIWKTSENIEVHSGYDFTGSFLNKIGLLHAQRSHIHLYHHKFPNKECFGKPVFMDLLHGTCDDYLIYLKQKHNKKILDF